jgi:hypothetical protein
MMLKLERLVAVLALELAQLGTHIMAHHVSLQSMQVIKQLVADFAREQLASILNAGLLALVRLI